jgi:hypothetical protein
MIDHHGLAWMIAATFVSGLAISGFWSWLLVRQLQEMRREAPPGIQAMAEAYRDHHDPPCHVVGCALDAALMSSCPTESHGVITTG